MSHARAGLWQIGGLNHTARHRKICPARVMLLAIGLCSHCAPLVRAAAAATVNACGTITTNTVWTAATVYAINNCAATVAGGATLTIQPGTVVKFGGSAAVLVVQGVDGAGERGRPDRLHQPARR